VRGGGDDGGAGEGALRLRKLYREGDGESIREVEAGMLTPFWLRKLRL